MLLPTIITCILYYILYIVKQLYLPDSPVDG